MREEEIQVVRPLLICTFREREREREKEIERTRERERRGRVYPL
jgi:hypothetical protein